MSRAGAAAMVLGFISSVSTSIVTAGSVVAGAPLGTTAPALTQAEATHFLDHSSFGPTAASIADVQKLGVARYIKEQFAVPATGYHGYADPSGPNVPANLFSHGNYSRGLPPRSYERALDNVAACHYAGDPSW
jgi:hypothetical protein